MIAWLLDNPRRRNLVVGLAVLLVVGVLVVVIGVRVHQGQQAWRSFQDAGGIGVQRGVVAGQHDEDHLERPSGEQVAADVVQAWLAGDQARFAELARPDIAASFAARPAPAGLSAGPVELVTDGDTYQAWSVALSDGTHATVSLSWAALGEARWTVVAVVLGA